MHARLSVAAAALALAAAGTPPQFTLYMLEDSVTTHGAMCLDGSPTGLYFQPGSGQDAYNWMIYFQGGGWCYDEADCYGRSKGTLGSSKAWPSNGTIGGMLANDCTHNPQFCNWSKVWMPYCDGNSFSGMREDPLVYNGTNLWFRGRHNIDAIMDAVAANVMNSPVKWQDAFDIVLTGCSAGGLATYLHADYFAQNYVAPKRPAPPGGPNRYGAYGVAPISGFFLDHNNVNGEPVYGNQIAVIHEMSNATYGVNDACIAGEGAGNEWHCNMAEYTYKYITSPIFALNSIYDSWQTGCILTAEPVSFPWSTANGNCSAAPGWSACAGNPESCTTAQMPAYNEYRSYMIDHYNATTTAHNPLNGGFLVSCHTHCEAQTTGYWSQVTVNGILMRDAVAAWWSDVAAGSASGNHWNVDCQYNANGSPHACNPTCS